MGEVPSDHYGDPDIRRIELMKGLHRTVASGLVGGFAGALLGVTAFVAVNALMPSTVAADSLSLDLGMGNQLTQTKLNE